MFHMLVKLNARNWLTVLRYFVCHDDAECHGAMPPTAVYWFRPLGWYTPARLGVPVMA